MTAPKRLLAALTACIEDGPAPGTVDKMVAVPVRDLEELLKLAERSAESEVSPRPNLEWRFRSRRERAAELQERMNQFGAIYRAGWMLRNAYFGPSARRHKAVMQFVAALLVALRDTDDYEACLYAVADTMMCSPLGVPWEP